MLIAQMNPPPTSRPETVCGETARPTNTPTKITTSHQFSSKIEATSGPVGTTARTCSCGGTGSGSSCTAGAGAATS